MELGLPKKKAIKKALAEKETSLNGN